MQLSRLLSMALCATTVAAATADSLCFYSCFRTVESEHRRGMRTCAQKPTCAARLPCLCGSGAPIGGLRACVYADCADQEIEYVERLCSNMTLGSGPDDESASGALSQAAAAAAAVTAELLMLVGL